MATAAFARATAGISPPGVPLILIDAISAHYAQAARAALIRTEDQDASLRDNGHWLHLRDVADDRFASAFEVVS